MSESEMSAVGTWLDPLRSEILTQDMPRSNSFFGRGSPFGGSGLYMSESEMYAVGT